MYHSYAVSGYREKQFLIDCLLRPSRIPRMDLDSESAVEVNSQAQSTVSYRVNSIDHVGGIKGKLAGIQFALWAIIFIRITLTSGRPRSIMACWRQRRRYFSPFGVNQVRRKVFTLVGKPLYYGLLLFRLATARLCPSAGCS